MRQPGLVHFTPTSAAHPEKIKAKCPLLPVLPCTFRWGFGLQTCRALAGLLFCVFRLFRMFRTLHRLASATSAQGFLTISSFKAPTDRNEIVEFFWKLLQLIVCLQLFGVVGQRLSMLSALTVKGSRCAVNSTTRRSR